MADPRALGTIRTFSDWHSQGKVHAEKAGFGILYVRRTLDVGHWTLRLADWEESGSNFQDVLCRCG